MDTDLTMEKPRKKPYTVSELFSIICGELKKEGRLPEILDYYSCPSGIGGEQIRTYQFWFEGSLNFGGNEGIYLDVYLKWDWDGMPVRKHAGVFKTLSTTREAMQEMGKLLADFIYTASSFVTDNMDDFTWTGYYVRGMKDGAPDKWGYECATLERALARKDKMLSGYKSVSIRDNATRKETVYQRERP